MDKGTKEDEGDKNLPRQSGNSDATCLKRTRPEMESRHKRKINDSKEAEDKMRVVQEEKKKAVNWGIY